MGIPSSLPTNPNPSPSPPLPQSPPPQTPPLPQSPPPQSPPLPPGQTPPLIPPTPLSPQTEPQNETPIFDTQSPEPMPEPEPTQTKSKDSTMLLHMDVCEKVGHTYALLQQHPEASGSADPTTFAPVEPQPTTTPQFSADILSLLRSLESKIASFTIQPSVPSPDTTEILATLKSLEVKIDTMGQQQNSRRTRCKEESLDK
ncbi:uncharacterized protein LOC131181411 [Hevea brasiliensis]|uniref:uncharacterized protein LOC131181411 n=1 Tax=Hevea brasiliensis TaxID=3981 RepID=UPI0025DFD11F|nr:uncharacterized protein LOC131181411 [Hevea brasiliensis]